MIMGLLINSLTKKILLHITMHYGRGESFMTLKSTTVIMGGGAQSDDIVIMGAQSDDIVTLVQSTA